MFGEKRNCNNSFCGFLKQSDDDADSRAKDSLTRIEAFRLSHFHRVLRSDRIELFILLAKCFAPNFSPLIRFTLWCRFSVHLKIHVPEVLHRHKHIKTKYVHVFHPKVIHHDHSSVQFLHSRRDPNVGNSGIVNGGYPQPLINMNKPELRITEAEFKKWQKDQMRKVYEERKRQAAYDQQQNQNENDANDDEEEEEEVDETRKEENLAPDEEDLYKKHKANKANSSRGSSKHKNHNYNRNQDFEASNSDKSFANYPNRSKSKKKQPKASPAVQSTGQQSRKKQQPPPYRQQYGFVDQREAQAQATNIRPQHYKMDPTDIDPTYYSTIPKDASVAASDNQDEIYSGLLSTKYTRLTADKSKLLGDMNYNRKQQAKSVAAANRENFNKN